MGKPGKRFQAFCERSRQRSRSLLKRIGMFAGGTALIVFGLAIGWLPGPGGFLAIVGVAMIAVELPIAAKFLDVCEIKIRGACQFMCTLFVRART